jgi:LacI family transcriptional regulator
MDMRAFQILTLCRLQGISVPDKLSVLGVDNDELLCSIADPPLSSIQINAEQGGFLAAAHLDGLMKNEINTGPERLFFGPVRVISRRSTEHSGIDHPMVAQAYEYIRGHAMLPINVNDVVRHVAVSRRVMEMRFKEVMGHTIHEEILNHRLNRIKELLIETDYSLTVIASMSGFDCEKYMSKVFLKKTGTTTSSFRKSFKLAAPEVK